MVNRRCWSSPFKLRVWVKANPKIPLFLLLFFIIISATGFFPGSFKGSSHAFQIARSHDGYEEYTSSRKLEVSTKGTDELSVNAPSNLGGSINLRVWDEDRCLVEVDLWAKADTEDKARDFVNMVEVELDKNHDLVELVLLTPRPAPWEGSEYGVRADLEIFVPENFGLKTKTFGFDLDIRGPLKEVDIENKYGETYVTDVSKQTRLEGTYNKVDIENVQGDLEVHTTYNSIYAREVDTKNGRASLKTTYGKIDLENIRGQIEAHTVYSPIYATGITLLGGISKIQTVYSKIELEIEDIQECQLYVKNTYGNINASVPTDLSAGLTLTVDLGGKIQTTGILITPTVLKKTRLEGVCGQGESKIELDVDGIGRIYLQGK